MVKTARSRPNAFVSPEDGLAYFDGITIKADPMTRANPQRVIPVLDLHVFACRRMGHRLTEGSRVLVPRAGNGFFAVWAAAHGCRVVAQTNSPRSEWVIRENVLRNKLALAEDVESWVNGSVGIVTDTANLARWCRKGDWDLVFLGPVFPVPDTFKGALADGFSLVKDLETTTGLECWATYGRGFAALHARMAIPDPPGLEGATSTKLTGRISWRRYCEKLGIDADDSGPAMEVELIELATSRRPRAPRSKPNGGWSQILKSLRGALDDRARPYSEPARSLFAIDLRTDPVQNDSAEKAYEYLNSPLRRVQNWLSNASKAELPDLLVIDTAPYYRLPEGFRRLPFEMFLFASPRLAQHAKSLLTQYQKVAGANIRCLLPFFHHPIRWQGGSWRSVHSSEFSEAVTIAEEGLTAVVPPATQTRHKEIIDSPPSPYPNPTRISSQGGISIFYASETAEMMGATTDTSLRELARQLRDDSFSLEAHGRFLDLFYHRSVRREFESILGDTRSFSYSSLRTMPVRLAPESTPQRHDQDEPRFRGVIWLWAFSISPWTWEKERFLRHLTRAVWLTYDNRYELDAEAGAQRVAEIRAHSGTSHELKHVASALDRWVSSASLKLFDVSKSGPQVSPSSPNRYGYLVHWTPFDNDHLAVLLRRDIVSAAAKYISLWTMSESRDDFRYLLDPSDPNRWPEELGPILKRSWDLIRTTALMHVMRVTGENDLPKLATTLTEVATRLGAEPNLEVTGDPIPKLAFKWEDGSKTLWLARFILAATREYFEHGNLALGQQAKLSHCTCNLLTGKHLLLELENSRLESAQDDAVGNLVNKYRAAVRIGYPTAGLALRGQDLLKDLAARFGGFVQFSGTANSFKTLLHFELGDDL